MRYKRTSKRRWKARFLNGGVIPHVVVIEFALLEWIQHRGASFSVDMDAWMIRT